MKNVMMKAWEIAKQGQKKFGGKVKEYFAEALKMAWAIIKKGVSEMTNYPKFVEMRAKELLESGDQPAMQYAQNKAEYEFGEMLNNFKKGAKPITREELINRLDGFEKQGMTVKQYVDFMVQADHMANSN